MIGGVRGYSPARTMSWSAFGHDRDPRECLLAIYVDYFAYYDAGGTQNDQSGALTVAGLISTEAKWCRFEREWEAVLKNYGVPYFHMKEYAHSTNHYASWKGDHVKRAEFLDKLIRVTKRGILKAFSVSAMMQDFHRVNREYCVAERFGNDHPNSGAYCFAAVLCSTSIAKWVWEKKGVHAKIKHVFEKGDTGQGALVELMRGPMFNNARSVEFLEKKSNDAEDIRYVREFEAADMIAWEHANYYRHMEKTGEPPARHSLTRLHFMVPYDARSAHAEEMLAYCAAHPHVIKRRAPITNDPADAQ